MAWAPGVVHVGGAEVSVAPGDLLTTAQALALRWGWDRGEVRRFLARRAKSAQITLEARAKWTRISVVGARSYLHPARERRAKSAQPAREVRASSILKERARHRVYTEEPPKSPAGAGDFSSFSREEGPSLDHLAVSPGGEA